MGTEKNRILINKIQVTLLWAVIILCLITGALYIVAASPLNPVSLRLPDIDSSIFIYFGYGMRAGKVPYRDMVDHKGPLLWTIQWLGLMIGNGKMTGIWFLEWFMMIADMILLFMCARFFIRNRLMCLLATGLSVEPLIVLLYGGNFSEEWALPFILLSLYIFLDYLMKDRLSSFRIILCGMSMGAVLCLRLNMIGLWLAFVIVVLIDMVIRKDWKIIGRCMIFFTAGICAVILPYIIYYWKEGALKDMWEWSVLRNISYVEIGSASLFSSGTVAYFMKLDALLYLPFLGMIIMMVIRRDFNRINIGECLFYTVSLLLCTLGGRALQHYAIVLIPAIIIPISYLLACTGKWMGKYHYLIIILAVLLLKDSIKVQNANIEKNLNADMNNDSVVEYILENTLESDPILVMSLNAYYYDATGRLANTRYFIQHFMYDYDYTLYDMVIQDIKNAPPKVIIMRKYNVDGDPWGEWMTKFYEDMCRKVEEGMYFYYETDFFVAFKLV